MALPQEFTIHVCERCGMQLFSSTIREDEQDPASYGHSEPYCWNTETATPPLFDVERIVFQRVPDGSFRPKETTKL